MLYAQLGYSSMFLFAVEELGYDRASAQRRVNAMELSRAVPEVLKMIDGKTICLQVAADIQTFLNKARGARRPYEVEQKVELVNSCLNLSTREVQRKLAALDPQVDFTQSKRFVSAERMQVTHTVSVEVEEKLDRIKGLLSHVNPYMTREDLLDYIAEIALEKLDPIRKAARVDKRKAKHARTRRQKSESVPAQEPSTLAPQASPPPTYNPIELTDEVVSDYGEIQLAVDFIRLDSLRGSMIHSPAIGYEASRMHSIRSAGNKRKASSEYGRSLTAILRRYSIDEARLRTTAETFRARA